MIEGETRMDKMNSEMTRNKLRLKKLPEKIEINQLRQIGHVQQMDEEKVVEIIWET